MLELEELKNKYIKYSEEITEDTFNKILDRAKEFAKEICPDLKTYRSFDDHSFDSFRLNKFFRFSGSSCSYGVDNNSQDAKEIEVSDILGEGTKFEVGKWYSFYWNWGSGYDIVAKVSELGEVVRFDNFINIKQGSHLDQSSNAIRLTEIKNIKELILEEIQQYLPDNHPDKIIKSIEKWSVGSYAVFCENNTGKNVLLNKPYKIIKKRLNSTYIDIINETGNLSATDYSSHFYVIKWFATLSEAETFSKELLKPKSLTVDDLVKGEIYKTQISGNTYLIRAINKLGGYDLCLIISSENPKLFRKAKSMSWDKIELPTSEEAKWFVVCEKQDKFVPKEDLSKYDSEGNLIEVKEYVHCETQEQWDFVLSKFNPADLSKSTFNSYENIGINLSDGHYTDSNWHNKEGYKKITFQEWLDLNGYTFTGRIVNKFNIGDEVQVCSKSEDLKGHGFLYSLSGKASPINGVAGSTGIIQSLEEYAGTIYYKLDCFPENGYISEDCLKLVKSFVASKKSKEMQLSDLKNPVFNVGDKVRVTADSLREFNDSWTDGNNTGYKKGYVGIITDIGSTSNYEVNAWCYLEDSISGISCNLLELVEPAKSSEPKVNRNVYYEVETQEQYNEILDWLESRGEFINSNSRILDVIGNWKYVVFNLSILDSWALDNLIPNLPKAEFQFKSKQKCEICNGEGGWTSDGFCDPCPECNGEGYIEKDVINSPIPAIKPIPEVETEIKFISSDEEPQIEIPKLKVITNKIDLLTLKN